MICTNCGNTFPDGMSSCPNCGAFITTPAGEVPNYAADPGFSAAPTAPADPYGDAGSFNAPGNYDAGGYDAGSYDAGSYNAGGYDAGTQNTYSASGNYGSTQNSYNTGYGSTTSNTSYSQTINRFGSIKEHHDYLFGILSYLSLIGLIIVGCSEPNTQKSDYLLFHFNQSLALLLFSLLSGIPIIGWIWAIFIIVCEIIAIIYAARGEMKSVAFFGNIKIVKK